MRSDILRIVNIFFTKVLTLNLDLVIWRMSEIQIDFFTNWLKSLSEELSNRKIVYDVNSEFWNRVNSNIDSSKCDSAYSELSVWTLKTE